MKSYKDGKYIIIELTDNEKDIIKFDLSTCHLIGKKGNPVKSLNSYLSNSSIDTFIESFPDKNYGSFLNEIYQLSDYPISNIGTLLKKITKYSILEQYFAIGVKVSAKIKTKISDCPKGLLKLAQKKNFTITDSVIITYNENPNLFHNVAIKEYELFDTTRLLTQNYLNYKSEIKYSKSYECLLELVNTYNYNINSLLDYVDRIMMYEGEDSGNDVIEVLYDYVKMISLINHNYEKYPKCLATTHNIITRIYNNHKIEFDEMLFQKVINPKLEFQYKEYAFINPKTTKDIKQEGINMNHCVASYIPKVLEKKTNIVFMRKKINIEESYITVEIKDNKIVQTQNSYKKQSGYGENDNIALKKYQEYLDTL